MSRKHGFFRPHLGRGFPQVASTTLREGGGWWLYGAALDLDFANNRAFNSTGNVVSTPGSILTVVRASAGSYFDSAGVLQQAANNALRYDYNPTTHEALGVLIEEQRTNLLTQSQTQTTGWSFDVSTGSGLTLDGGLGPDGVNQLCTFNEGTSTSAHRANKSTTTVAATAYTYSAYFRAGTSRYIIFGSTRGGIAIDTENWSITETITSAGTTVTNGTLTQVGTGLYRASVAVSHTSDTTSFIVVSTATTGTPGSMAPSFLGTSRTALFGFCQIEAGSFPTSYIPTVASQVTRAADQVSILTSAFAFSATEGSVLVSVTPIALNTGNIFNINAGGLDATSIYSTPNTSSHLVVRDTATQANIDAGTFVAAQQSKIAVAYKANDFAASIDGGAAVTDTSGTIPASMATLCVGTSAPKSGAVNGRIKRLTYFPTRKSDAELQALSA